MADDLGFGDTGFNGNNIIKTPSLDAMAKAGLRFTRFYSAAPVCSPTRGSCLTGRHPYRYGITFANVGHMPKAEITLAEALKTQGYTTGHFGKWHLGTLTKTEKESNRGGPRGAKHYSPPWENGFDICFSTEAKVPTWDPMKKPESNEHYGTYYWTQDGAKATENLDGDDSHYGPCYSLCPQCCKTKKAVPNCSLVSHTSPARYSRSKISKDVFAVQRR
jgi:arylsulfatase A-like enzyme